MNKKFLAEILEKLESGDIPKEKVIDEILNKRLTQEYNFANIDYQREERLGFPEVVFGSDKTVEQIIKISKSIFNHSGVILITRTNNKVFKFVLEEIPSAKFSKISKCIWADKRKEKSLIDGITIISAGTSDLPIAEEAKITANLMGCSVKMITDVGVAGLHRLTNRLEEIRKSKILIVVAGMEGALPSVISGLVKSPIIAVPSSIGYGANFGGISALLSMINSCAPGISVVNVNNGFGAGYQAAMILKMVEETI